MTKTHLINTGDAIRDGLIEVAKKDSSVIFFAEGVSDPSSVYGTIKGLKDHISSDSILSG